MDLLQGFNYFIFSENMREVSIHLLCNSSRDYTCNLTNIGGRGGSVDVLEVGDCCSCYAIFVFTPFTFIIPKAQGCVLLTSI